jgi:hypothetical protein
MHDFKWYYIATVAMPQILEFIEEVCAVIFPSGTHLRPSASMAVL